MRFPEVFCSQCGKGFGPGDNGFSHCSSHREKNLTKVQRLALKALRDHGGEGVMTKTGTMLARGAELGHGEDGEGSREEGWEVDFFQRSTWKALLALGLIQEIAPRRYRAVQP